MAKKKLGMGILAMALVFAMVALGCDTGGGGGGGGSGNQQTPPPAQTTRHITITGIPAGFTGIVDEQVILFNNFDNYVAWGTTGTSSGSSFTVILRNPANTANWTGSGNFFLVLFLDDGADGNFFIYTGGSSWAALGINVNSTEAQVLAALPRRNVSTATQTINFNQFRELLNWAWL